MVEVVCGDASDERSPRQLTADRPPADLRPTQPRERRTEPRVLGVEQRLAPAPVGPRVDVGEGNQSLPLSAKLPRLAAVSRRHATYFQ